MRTGRSSPDSSARTAPTIGVPTAAARWSGPVSPDTNTRAPRASASTSPMPVGGAGDAAPPDAAAIALGHRPLARPPQHERCAARAARRSHAASAAKRSAGQRLFGQPAPGLSSAYGPGRQLPRRHVERELDPRRIGADRGRQGQVLPDHVARVVDGMGLGVGERRQRLAQGGAVEADHAPGARPAGEHAPT